MSNQFHLIVGTPVANPAFALEQVDSSTFPGISEFVNEAIRSPLTAATNTLSGRWAHVIGDK